MDNKLVKSAFKGNQSAESSGVTWEIQGASGFALQVFREYYGQMCELRVYDKATRKVVAKFPYSLKEVRDGKAPLLFDFLNEQVKLAAYLDNEDENA